MLETLLKTVGRSLLFSCMIPATVFVIVTLVLFAPQLPKDFLVWLKIDGSDFSVVLAIVLVTSFTIAYTLMILNWALVRLYEGYYLPFPFGKCVEGRKKRRLARRVAELEENLEKLSPGDDFYQRKWREYIEEKGQLTARFPDNKDDILSTRLGNIYRAFEEYPFVRYGMDGIFFWPRLSKVIPIDYATKIEAMNTAVAFLVNSSFISLLISGEVTIALGQIKAWLEPRAFIVPICLGLSCLFYYAATSTALTYGQYVRTCYDLFRLDLLAALRIEAPDNPDDEKELWRRVHEFLVLGESSPYQRRAPNYFPGKLLHTAGQLVRTWATLVVWNGLNYVLEWLAITVDNSQMNTVPIRASEGAE